MSYRRIPLALAVVVTVFLPGRALALWPHPPGGSVEVAPTAGSQSSARAVSDGAGGMLVAWVELDNPNTIRIQRVDAAGVPRWTPTGVVLCAAPGTRDQIAIRADGEGGAFVAWRDLRGADHDLYAAHVLSDGSISTPANGAALCTAAGDQSGPVVVNLGAGTAVAAWTDGRGADLDVYAQRFTSTGSIGWTANGVAVAATGGHQSSPDLVVTPLQTLVLAWEDSRNGFYDIYAQRLTSGSGAPFWAVNGVAISAAADNQSGPSIVGDGGEGAIVAWSDERTGLDIYAARVNSSGTSLWTADGVPLAVATGDQLFVQLVSDGAGGAIATWSDFRSGSDRHYYAQRVAGNGAVQWAIDGIPVCATYGSRAGLQAVSDGLGGVLATWYDDRFGSRDVFTQRIPPSGFAMWEADGVRAIGSPYDDELPTVAPDGSGGALVAAQMNVFSNPDLMAKRVDRFGAMGAEPAIAAVTDVPNDQGGQVRVAWNASALDTDPLFLSIADYQIFRAVPASAARARLAAGARLVEALETPDPAALLRTVAAGATYFWEYVGVQSAFELPGYSFIVATTGDSVDGFNPLTAFMVRARGENRDQYWDSAPDSGYSVDNLAPAAPAPFTGQYGAGTTAMAWGANAEPDLAFYRLYRGTSASFAPDPGNRVAELAATSYVDGAGEPYFYKLSAVDLHGNEGPHALLQPEGTVDVGGEGRPAELALAPVAPNPAAHEAWVRFTLPEAGHVRIDLLDAAGRRVATLASRRFDAGTHAVRWSRGDAVRRPLEPGLYFARLAAQGRVLTRRFAIVR